LGDCLVILPPLALPLDVLDEMCHTIVTCIRTVTEAD